MEWRTTRRLSTNAPYNFDFHTAEGPSKHTRNRPRKATAATPTFGDYTSPPPGFRELPAEPPEKSWSYTPILIYAFAALALFFAVFLRGSHNVFFLGLVNGAVLAACCCLRDAPRKSSYHLSQP